MNVDNFKSKLFELKDQDEYMNKVSKELKYLFEDTPNSGIEEAFENFIINAELPSHLERNISYYFACEIFHSIFSSSNKILNIEFKGLNFNHGYIDKMIKSLIIQAKTFDITILHRHQ
jgi:hypothetical protein